MLNILWLFISYILGSLPFGYIISRLSGKNILEIGWRKTSGSNVFRNVGMWQGVLTGALDLLKGSVAVFGAQKLGLSPEIQILSGLAAVCGHNWSVFLKFAGGRGIGTFCGALLFFSPKMLGLALVLFGIFALLWDSSIATLIALFAIIFTSIKLGQFHSTGIFTLISLAPILIKRLSPIAEIPKAKNRITLLMRRLLLDGDEAKEEWRIKRIIKKISERKGK